MSDLIDRQGLLETLEYGRELINRCMEDMDIDYNTRNELAGELEAFNSFIEDVQGMPSIVPVITCDGCRYVGTYDSELPCRNCIRRERDFYKPEE